MLLIITNSLFSQENGSKDRLIFLSTFDPFESDKNQQIETSIVESLRSVLEEKKFKVVIVSGNTWERKLAEAKDKGGFLYVDGFYTKKSRDSNLNIYIQIYNPETGFVIDAINLTDEIEGLYHFGKYISGFVNYSVAQRVAERIQDKNVSPNQKQTTWYPRETGNFGLNFNWTRFTTSISIERQGKVLRRKYSDYTQLDPLYSYPTSVPEPSPTSNYLYRPVNVAPWTNINLRFMYKIIEDAQIGISILNAANSSQFLVLNKAFPFDYRREGRRFIFEFNMTF